MNRLPPPRPLPHPMQQQMDAHESIYWTCIAVGNFCGMLVMYALMEFFK